MFVAKRQTNTRASKTFSIQVKQQLTGREQKCELFGQPPSASKQKCKNLHLLKNSYTLGTQKPIQFTNWFTQKTLYLGHTQQTHNFKIQELYYTTNISNKNIFLMQKLTLFILNANGI